MQMRASWLRIPVRYLTDSQLLAADPAATGSVGR